MAWNVNNDLVKGHDLYLYIVMPAGSAETITLPTSGEVATARADTAHTTVAWTGASEVVAYATSCSLNIDADTLDTSSKLSCRWNSVMQGNASYTVSADALYCRQANASANTAYTIDDLFEKMVEGKNVGWIMAQDASETCGTIAGPDLKQVVYAGTGAITSLSIEAGNNEVVSSSITITGDGKPERDGK